MALTALQALQAYVSDNDEFVSRFGQATQDNFTKWANGVIDNPEVQNSFLKYLINKIGRTYVNSMFANNPLAFLRGEDLPLGSTIEDLFVNITKAMAFDPEGKRTLDRFVPDVRVLYYTVNSDLEYVVSVSNKEIKLAFFRDGAMQTLIERIVNSLYQSARHDMFVLLKQLMAGYDGYFNVTVPAMDGTEANAKQVGAALKSAVKYAEFDNTAYNAFGVMNNIPSGEGLLLMTVAASVALDFDYLANVFNLSKAEITARTVIVDNFGGRSDILAIYCDKRIFQNHFVYEGVETQRNAQGRFTNYWLCEEAIYAMSKYMTAIAFTTSATVEVAFDANGGGSETMPRRYGIAGKKMSVPMSGFTPPEGKEFVGWGLAQTDAVTSAVAPASDIQIAEDASSKITLYAIYQAKS